MGLLVDEDVVPDAEEVPPDTAGEPDPEGVEAEELLEAIAFALELI